MTSSTESIGSAVSALAATQRRALLADIANQRRKLLVQLIQDQVSDDGSATALRAVCVCARAHCAHFAKVTLYGGGGAKQSGRLTELLASTIARLPKPSAQLSAAKAAVDVDGSAAIDLRALVWRAVPLVTKEVALSFERSLPI